MKQIWEFILMIFNTPIVEMTGWQIIVLVLLSIAVIWLSLKVLKYAWITIKTVFRTLHNVFSAKKKCQKIQCPHCGRTLDKCICQRNQKRGYLSRIYHYKRDD